MKFLFILSFIFLSCHHKSFDSARPVTTGKVIKIVDGDTYDILLEDNKTKRIRMDGIDAPERGMPFYKVSKDYLGLLCFGQMVRLEQTDTDQYGRMVAKTYQQNGDELGLLMIKAGYAWHFKKYSSDRKLSNAEKDARKKKAGLWKDESPVAPWEWRSAKRKSSRQTAVGYQP
jgi:endonuclease YncB( thermonuclease family)